MNVAPSGTGAGALIVAAAGACLLGLACVIDPARDSALPVHDPSTRTHESSPASPTGRAPAASPRRLALPTEVRVALSTDAGARVIEARTTAGDLRVDRPATHAGPFWLDGARHDGRLDVVRATGGGLRAVVTLPLETYVAGVVAAELSLWSAEPAELEAQAIAARTFAATELQRSGRKALTDGVLDQAYRGTYEGIGSRGAAAAAERLRAAIRATQGQVLVRGDRFEEARYHASCGGHTANFDDVFADEVAMFGAVGPTGVPCAPCEARRRAEERAGAPAAKRPLGWTHELPASFLGKLGRDLGLGGRPDRLAAASMDDHGRWIAVAFERDGRRARLTFDDLRARAGYGALRSASVVATSPRAGAPLGTGGLTIHGVGRGHGVGLCQEAARDLARAGNSSHSILAHYYRGARIARLTAGGDSR